MRALGRPGVLDEGLEPRAPARARQVHEPGVEPALADEVVGEALRGVNELEEALAVAEKRVKTMGGLDQAVIKRRLAGYLSRRGFSMDTVYRVLERVL